MSDLNTADPYAAQAHARAQAGTRAEAMPGEDPMDLPHPSEIGPMIVDLAQSDLGQPTSSVLFSDWKLRSGSPASA